MGKLHELSGDKSLLLIFPIKVCPKSGDFESGVIFSDYCARQMRGHTVLNDFFKSVFTQENDQVEQ